MELVPSGSPEPGDEPGSVFAVPFHGHDSRQHSMKLDRECREVPEVLGQRFGPLPVGARQMDELVHKQEQPGSELRNNRDVLLDDETCTFKS